MDKKNMLRNIILGSVMIGLISPALVSAKTENLKYDGGETRIYQPSENIENKIIMRKPYSGCSTLMCDFWKERDGNLEREIIFDYNADGKFDSNDVYRYEDYSSGTNEYVCADGKENSGKEVRKAASRYKSIKEMFDSYKK